jgi:hypothetical protein
MFVVGRFNAPLQNELDFTTEMIYSNFSNYSAWHHRSRLLESIKSQNLDLYNETIEAGKSMFNNLRFGTLQSGHLYTTRRSSSVVLFGLVMQPK